MPAALTEVDSSTQYFDRLALDGGPPLLASSSIARWPSSATVQSVDLVGALRRRAEPPDRLARKLERRWQNTIGVAHVVACPSTVTALKLAVTGLDLSAGDEIVCPVDAELAASMAAATAATPVFVDLDPKTMLLDPAMVEAAITKRTRAIMVLDHHGTTVDYGAIDALAKRYRLAVIEDCSQAIGASYRQRPAGALGTVSICSLPGRATSSGVGAAALFATDDDEVAERVRRLTLIESDLLPPPLEMPSGVLGWTYRVTELEASLADTELQRVKAETEVRSRNGDRLRRMLEAVPGLSAPERTRAATQVYATFPLVVVPDEVGLGEDTASALRDTIIDCMTAEGLWADRWRPAPSALADSGREFPVAESLWAGGLFLGDQRSLSNPSPDEDSVERIAGCFRKVVVDNVARIRQLTLQRLATTR